jgi:hypothetical protein
MSGDKRSRYRPIDPSRGPSSKSFPTERDLAIFKRLDLRRFSASNWLHYFIGGHYTRFDHRLSQLYDGGYIGRIAEHIPVQAVHSRNLVYFLTDKGRRVLIEHGIQPIFASTRQYLHECLGAFIDDSMEIGVREEGLRYIPWTDIQHDPRVNARHSENPFKIKLSNNYLYLDGSPYVIATPNGTSICVPGAEWDRDTEPLRAFKLREKWTTKLHAHAEFVNGRFWQSHYGFTSCVIPIYTINRQHMANIMTLAKDTLGPVTWLLFQHVDDWPKSRKFPKPNGRMFVEPYATLTGQPYYFSRLAKEHHFAESNRSEIERIKAGRTRYT